MKPPNPGSFLLLVNATLLPYWILTHLCRNSSSHTTEPSLTVTQQFLNSMQAFVKLSMSLDFVSCFWGSCFLHIGINSRAGSFFFPAIYCMQQDQRDLSNEGRNQLVMRILAGPSGLAHPSPAGQLVSPCLPGVPLSDSENKESALR